MVMFIERVARYGSMPVREQTSDSALVVEVSVRSGYSRPAKPFIYLTSQQLNPIFPTVRTRGVAMGVRTALGQRRCCARVSLSAQFYIRRTEVRPFTDRQIKSARDLCGSSP